MRVLLIVILSFAGVAFAQDAPKIKVGDKVRLTCEEEPTLNKDYAVSQQGMVLIDFLGAVKVQGLTESEAARTIADRLISERILRQATVRVKIVNSTAAPVTYRGVVRQTGQEPHKDSLRLSDIVKKAQPTDQTDLSRIEIRNGNSVAMVDFTKFDPATNANNPLLKPGDTVIFSAKSAPGLVVVLGGVERAGGITYERGMTVRSAIEKAGGFSSLAVLTNVKLEREGRPTQVLDLTRSNVNAPVQEGDRILVETKEERQYVQVSGAVQKGGFVEFIPGMTLLKALQAGGGLSEDANQDKVRLTRRGEDKSVTYNVEALKTGKVVDPRLNPGDKVMVESKRSNRNQVLETVAAIALLFILLGR